MNNNMATFYSEGITQRRPCYMRKARMEAIILKGERGYNLLKSAIIRIDEKDQIGGLKIGGIPVLIYHTSEESTITAFYDQRNAGIEISARDPARIIASASKIGLPIDELTLMLSNPERFDARTNFQNKLFISKALGVTTPKLEGIDIPDSAGKIPFLTKGVLELLNINKKII